MINKPDLGERYTDAETLMLEKRMRKVYEQAQKDIDQKMIDFTEGFANRDAKYRKQVASGKMAKEDYQAWLSGQVFQGRKWQQRQEEIANTLYNANNAAHKMAQSKVAGVFAFNANYLSYRAEMGARVNLGLTIYNEAAVINLIKNEPDILPQKKLNKAKDIRWNMQGIRNQLTQGIIQGESIDQLTKRVATEMPNRSFKQARVHARTMMTSAQNAGRLESMRMHREMGIDSVKIWIATLDERTRWMHRDLDGQEQDIEKPFEIGQYTIMYPGDPYAAPAMVYNCRCRMDEDIKKYPAENNVRRDNITQETIPYMTYNEWAEMKGIANERPSGYTPIMPKSGVPSVTKAENYAKKLLSTMAATDAAEVAKLIDDSDEDMRYLYETYTEQCRTIVRSANGGAYTESLDKVEYSFNNYYPEQHKCTTMAHEMGHMFDAKIGRHDGFNYTEADMINDRCAFGSGIYKTLKVKASSSDEFLAAVRLDKDVLREKLKDITFLADVIRKRDASAGLQDALDGMFGTRGKNHISGLNWGHGDKYYNRFYNNKVKGFGKEKELKAIYKELGFDAGSQEKVKWISRDYETASEVWANVSSAVLCKGGELEYFEKYMPNTMKTFRDMIRKVAHG